MRCLLWLVLTACALLTACKEASLPPGVVALVNGQPIHLRTLQTMQDTRTTALGAFEKPSLTTLRQQYGSALTALIVQSLVAQELEKLDMAVSEAAVAEAEARIREDYPEEEFDKHIKENSIDLDAWRELMRFRLSMANFRTQVLQPGIVVPLDEVEKYYEAHKNDFKLPRMLTLYQVSGEDKGAVEKARSAGEIPDEGAGLRVYRLNMRRDSLPEEWKKAVLALKAGQSTAVMPAENGFAYMTLMTDTAGRELNIVDAYPHIEQFLLEEKTDLAFEAWLEKRLQSTQVLVSVHLAEEMRATPGQ